MKNKTEILENLSQFYGTQNYFRISPLLVLTDGAKYLAESCGAFWLFDILGSILTDKKIVSYFKRYSPVPVRIKLDGKGGAVVSVGNEKKPIYSQKIESTDFPLDEYSFYVGDNGDYFVALLHGEN